MADHHESRNHPDAHRPWRDFAGGVLIVGGGVAGLEALLALHADSGPELRLSLVSDRPVFVLRPQLLGEAWGAPALRADLEQLTVDLDVTFHTGTLVGVDVASRRAHFTGGSSLAYDELVVAIGARPSIAYPHVVTVGFGPLPDRLATATTGDLAIVVPPGTGWTLPAYQLALLTAGTNGRDVVVVTPEQVPLERFGPAPARAASAMLADAGVRVRTRCTVPPGVDASALADTVVALPLQHGPRLEGLSSSRLGGFEVDGHMRLAGVEHVHVIGDATAGPIKQGGLASQQAETAVSDLLHVPGSGRRLPPEAPVLRGILEHPLGARLHLRRVLDGIDPGGVSSAPLWTPDAPLAAPRLVDWLLRERASRHPDPRSVVP